MEIVESFGGIGSSNLLQDCFSSGVRIKKVCDIVDFAVDNKPKGIFGIVLSHLVTRKSLVRHRVWLLL